MKQKHKRKQKPMQKKMPNPKQMQKQEQSRNRIFTSKTNLFVGMYLCISFTGLCVLAILSVAKMRMQKGRMGAEFFGIVAMLGLTAFIWFMYNRTACEIRIEGDKIVRRGLFFGFRKECRIDEIKAVELIYTYRGGQYLFLIDGKSPYGYACLRKESYISFYNNQRNRKFLRQFWHGGIKSGVVRRTGRRNIGDLF